MSNATNSMPSPVGGLLLIDAKGLATMLGLGLTKLYAMQSNGHLPAPLKFGRASRWRVDEIREWIENGCPERSRWQAVKGGRR